MGMESVHQERVDRMRPLPIPFPAFATWKTLRPLNTSLSLLQILQFFWLGNSTWSHPTAILSSTHWQKMLLIWAFTLPTSNTCPGPDL